MISTLINSIYHYSFVCGGIMGKALDGGIVVSEYKL